MISQIHSAVTEGFNGRLIAVEGDLSQGLPSFNIVGMGNKTVSESKDRVKSALRASDFSFPDSKITINLAPAAVPKEGTGLDLPIALSILILSKQLLQDDVKHRLFVGELSLNGALRPIPGIINVIEAAKRRGFKEVYLPTKNLSQASLISGIDLIGVSSLKDLFLHLKGQLDLKDRSRPTTHQTQNVVKNTETEKDQPILDHIHGQSFAKRALQIAVAGHHNILFAGPPGAGKTLLARTALNLLPPLSKDEQLTITKLYSLANLSDTIVTSRPFRAPHHSSSLSAFLGDAIRPGEISLAHTGVLFLDELPEYPRNLLESLRQPLEDHQITIARVRKQATYPANFMLIATMNPCPCGYFGDPLHECTCTPQQVHNYQHKLSGPLLDRIDLYINVQKVEITDLQSKLPDSDKEHLAAKFAIQKALHRQHRRYHSSSTHNSSLSSHQVAKLCQLAPAAESLLQTAAEKLNLSARSYFKTIKVARTIADLESSDIITPDHLSEALSYRHKD